MNVTLTIEDAATVFVDGSVIVATGTDEQGRRIRFAGDARPMDQALSALVIGDESEVDVVIEEWQILGTA